MEKGTTIPLLLMPVCLHFVHRKIVTDKTLTSSSHFKHMILCSITQLPAGFVVVVVVVVVCLFVCLFCFVLFCFVLFCFVLFCFVLFCFVLFCFVLFCFVLLLLVA